MNIKLKNLATTDRALEISQEKNFFYVVKFIEQGKTRQILTVSDEDVLKLANAILENEANKVLEK